MARADAPTSAARMALIVFRRAFVAVGVAAVISTVVRFLPHGPTPSRHGGWRDVPPSELEELS